LFKLLPAKKESISWFFSQKSTRIQTPKTKKLKLKVFRFVFARFLLYHFLFFIYYFYLFYLFFFGFFCFSSGVIKCWSLFWLCLKMFCFVHSFSESILNMFFEKCFELLDVVFFYFCSTCFQRKHFSMFSQKSTNTPKSKTSKTKSKHEIVSVWFCLACFFVRYFSVFFFCFWCLKGLNIVLFFWKCFVFLVQFSIAKINFKIFVWEMFWNITCCFL